MRKPPEIKYCAPYVKNKGCYKKPFMKEIAVHGAKEMERRKLQIERGKLKRENGLAV